MWVLMQAKNRWTQTLSHHLKCLKPYTDPKRREVQTNVTIDPMLLLTPKTRERSRAPARHSDGANIEPLGWCC